MTPYLTLPCLALPYLYLTLPHLTLSYLILSHLTYMSKMEIANNVGFLKWRNNTNMFCFRDNNHLCTWCIFVIQRLNIFINFGIMTKKGCKVRMLLMPILFHTFDVDVPPVLATTNNEEFETTVSNATFVLHVLCLVPASVPPC